MGNDLKISFTPDLIKEINYTDARKKLHEVLTDSAGRFGNHIAEEHNIEIERQRRATDNIAEDIDKIVEAEKPEKLFLAFSQEMNAQLIDLLSTQTKELLAKNIASNLVKTDKEKLLSYFE